MAQADSSSTSAVLAPATPLPWAVAGDRLYSAAGGMARGVATGMLSQDAEYAARACNSHYGLLEVAQQALFWLEGPARHKAVAAIAKARGEQA
jgi:hypothetical protein